MRTDRLGCLLGCARFSPWLKSKVAKVWRKACGRITCALIRDFFKYLFTRFQTAPGEILTFLQAMNNALVRVLHLLCFKYDFGSIFANLASASGQRSEAVGRLAARVWRRSIQSETESWPFHSTKSQPRFLLIVLVSFVLDQSPIYSRYIFELEGAE
jgi:hypothetical protein